MARRRRRVVTGVAIVVGAELLAATLRVPEGPTWFTVLGLLVAATWTVGSFVSGPIPFHHTRPIDASFERRLEWVAYPCMPPGSNDLWRRHVTPDSAMADSSSLP